MHRPVIALVLLALAGAAFAKDTPPPRTVEVCFVLDTTGSMSALIDGAKRKIWSIANDIVLLKPTPTVRVGLIGYRDRGDQYVTKVTDLTEDLDAVYADLTAYRADGGGDGPESVNQALHEAITKVAWTKGDTVTRIVFLVGDAPPHMDYQDDVKYDVTCKLAAERGIVINTIRTGSVGGTEKVWREIATLAQGGYAEIPHDGQVVRVIETPMDARLAELNVEVGKTILAYGSREARSAVSRKQSLAERADAAVAADRLAYNDATKCVVQGGGDLIDAVDGDVVKLAEVDPKDLPEPMQKMTPAEREQHITELRAKRAALQAEIAKLLKERDAYIAAERKKEAEKSGAEADKDAFDTKVKELIEKQAK